MTLARHDTSPVATAPSVPMWVRRDGVTLAERSFAIGDTVRVGRDEGCCVELDDRAASRHHARLQLRPGGVLVLDESTNGTVVDGELVHHASRLADYGVTVCLGATEITVGTSQPLLAQMDPARANSVEVLVPKVVGRGPSGESTPAPSMPEPPPTWDATSDPSAAQGATDLVRREVHRRLLEQLDMTTIAPGEAEDPTLRPRVLSALRRIVASLASNLPAGMTQESLVGEMADEALGLGPLEALLADRTVSEIMVLDAQHIYVERGGAIQPTSLRFTDDERLRAVIERIVTPLGRRIDESSPLVDARLPDGSRVNVVIRPIALRGATVTIRKFATEPFGLEDLLARGGLSPAMGRFLVACVKARKNIVISGGTGSGKTTLLNVLSGAIPSSERIVTIEDAAELQLVQPHVVALEARPTNMEGKGEVSIRALVRNALRMRPDRIVVGECRGAEALDMLQAMNTGHDGSLTTTHANSPTEALMRLETLALMAGVGLPQEALRRQMAQSLHVIVQQARLSDGSRKVTAITEVAGLDRNGAYRLRPLFTYRQVGAEGAGAVQGDFVATGYLPEFLPDMLTKGVWSASEALL